MPDSPEDSSYSLLAAIVDSSDDAIISKNLDGIITTWNRGAEKIFGYTAEEAVGQSILLLIPPSLHQEEATILNKLRRGESINHFETIRQTKDGRLLNISLTISPVRRADGTIVGASKIARNITPQVELLNELRQSEERFRTTLESIGDAVIATDNRGNVTFMNSLAETLTGWSITEVKGHPLEEIFRIVNEFTRETVENPVHVVLQRGVVVGLANHTILIAKDGTERPIDDSGAPIRGPKGELSGVVLVFRDVTERRRAEVAAYRLAALIHSSDDAIIAKDLTGTITDWNEGARRIFGYTTEEIVGKSVLTLIPPELQEQEREILQRLRNGERVDHFETVRVTKEGRPLQISLSISPIKDDNGRIIGASKIARDITQRKEVERALAEAKEQLQNYASELEKRVDDRTHQLKQTIGELEAFSYSLSHDLRSPLRAVQGYVEMFLEENGSSISASGADMLKRAVNSTQRMDEMVLDLLAFTRLSHEEMPLQPVDVGSLLKNLIEERPEYHSPNAEIKLIEPLCKVLGNEASLRQCFVNLLDNAVKFIRSGTRPEIEIGAEQHGSMVRLYVQDNGIGLSADDGAKLFRMFRRAHRGDFPGTGIGLAIVRKAAERMGGIAGVDGGLPVGSRFWIQVPGAPE